MSLPQNQINKSNSIKQRSVQFLPNLENFKGKTPGSDHNPKMNGAVSRRTRKTLLSNLSSPEIGAGSTGQRTTLLDAIQEEAAANARAPPQRDPAQPIRVSLMTLLTLGEDALAKDPSPSGSISAKGVIRAEVSPAEDAAEDSAAAEEEKMLCCVCMVNRKGAAFIPCGHTFCRACSRALVTRRGNCPICNEVIFDILDIF